MTQITALHISMWERTVKKVTNIFKNSHFYNLLENNNLNIPEASTVEDLRGEIPYVFVADEAFSLSQQILRPYSGNQLTDKKKKKI